MRNNTKKGFTLVELLVVIAILAILATVSVVGYTSFIERATVSNDENIAAQLNNFLVAYQADHTSKYYGEDVNEDNIREITQEILDLGGLDELVPQSVDYGYHFYFDLEKGKYKVGKINNQGLLETLIHADDNKGKYLGSCFTPDNNYFLVDTAGSDLADVVNGFYGAKTEADIQLALEKANALSGEPASVVLNIQNYVNAGVNVIIDGTQYVTKETGTTNVVFTDGTTKVLADVVVVGNPEATVDNFVVNEDASVTITITIPSTVKYVEEGAMIVNGNVVIVINKTSSEVAGMATGSFTNAPLELEDGEFTTTDDGYITNGSVSEKLDYKNDAVDFGLSVDDTALTVGIRDDKGNKTNSGYVAWELDGFVLNLDGIGKDPTIPATGLDNVTFEVVSGAGVKEFDGNRVVFDKAVTPDKAIEVKATTTLNGEEIVRTFTIKVERITGITGTIGGDEFGDDDHVANLVCQDPDGSTFTVVPSLSYVYGNTGLQLSEELILQFVSDGHVHGDACCSHKTHDENCLVCPVHDKDTCDGTCEYRICGHKTHTADCCDHDHTSTCYEGSCTHVVGGTHTKADGTSCYANCSTAHKTHKANCSQHYYETIWGKGPKHEHTDACCGHIQGGWHVDRHKCGMTGLAEGNANCSIYQDYLAGNSTHVHDKNCCIYGGDNRGVDYSDGSYCVHNIGYHDANGVLVEYHLSGCGTCTHLTDGEHDNCASELICGHTDGIAHNCDECKHKVPNHDCTEPTCGFTCTGVGDCIKCIHDCEKEGCESKCTYKPAEKNGNGVTAYGNESGKLIIKVGSYVTYEVTLNFFGDFEADKKGNVTHLGSVTSGAESNTNVIKVEDLFRNGVPTDAVIVLFDGARINSATDDYMNINRTLLPNKELAATLPATFYCEDNIINCVDGVWEDIKLYGEGTVYIAVVSQHEVTGNKLTGIRISDDIVASVVVGKNVRNYSELSNNGSNILLKDITMSSGATFTFNGGTLYGNHNTFDIQQGKNINVNGIIVLNNANMKDLRVIGAYYPEVAIAGPQLYGANAVLAKGTVTIDNCYIANTRAPLAAGYEDDTMADVITVKDTVIFGGRYANIDVREGTIIFEGKVITVNQPYTTEKDVATVDENLLVAGLGVVVWFEGNEANIYGVHNLVQYNFISENFKNVPDASVDYSGSFTISEKIDVKGLFKEVFGNTQKYGDYYFERDGVRYMNASIITEDLGEKFSDAYTPLVEKYIPYGDRTAFENNKLPVGYQYEGYSTTIVNGTYTVYLHMYGLTNDPEVTDERQDSIFADSQGAEYIYSPWVHDVNGQTLSAYGFGNDNSIIVNDLNK